MDFAFGHEQELLRTSTRRFLERRQPMAAVRERLEAPDVVDRAVWRDGAELGWAAMLVPAEHDGGSVTEQPLVDLLVLAEETGRALYPGPFVPTNVVADAVARCGTDVQRKEVLPGLAGGETMAAWCLSADGTPGAAGVTATRDGDRLRLDGVARYVQAADVADLLLVATTAGHVLVPVPTEGVSVRVHRGLDLTRRFGEVRFDGAVVPASAALPDDPGERALAVATVLTAAQAVGAADHLFAVTLQYAKDRVQFGRPIGSFQAVKHRLADLLISVEAMRAATHDAGMALADGLDDAAEAVATAGAYVPDTFAELCGECLQVHGGIGFTWEHDVHLFLRRAKVDQVLYGEAAWHRERLTSLVEATA